ncbi:MAG TPA: XylR N-terminal domain-containing protein, partial [Polyangiaceae bacterium]
MKAADLDLRELLHFEPQGGLLTFGGQRALLFDAVALGILRRELIEQLGLAGARGVLTRFGYAHGRRRSIASRYARTVFSGLKEFLQRLVGRAGEVRAPADFGHAELAQLDGELGALRDQRDAVDHR